MRRARGESFLSSWTGAAACVAAVLSACSSQDSPPDILPEPPPPPVVLNGYAISARGGIADTGSGIPGLALLTTVRDETGAGPAVPWEGMVIGDGFSVAPGMVSYDAPGPGSYVAWAWPRVDIDTPVSFTEP